MVIQKMYSEVEGPERLYSVLMSEDELYLFSEAEELSKTDKFNRWSHKVSGKSQRKIERALASDDMKTATKESLKRDGKIAAITATAGALGGSLLGRGGKGRLKAAAIGAGIGGATGGSTLIGDAIGLPLRHSLNKTKKVSKNNLEMLNMLDLAEGKISEKDYLIRKKKINHKS